MIKAALFDMDGTLIDLFDQYLVSYQHVIKEEFGLDYPREHLEKMYGSTAEVIINDFLKDKDAEEYNVHEIVTKRRKHGMVRMNEVPLLPRVPEILDLLKDNGVKLALATSGNKEMSYAALEKADLLKYFEVVLTSADIEKSKPDPEIFLKAAEQLEVKPEECVVFEDSVHGVGAGKNAGMKVIAVTTGKKTREELEVENPDIVVDSLEELSLDNIIKT